MRQMINWSGTKLSSIMVKRRNNESFETPAGPTVNIVHIASYGPKPQQMTCPRCRANIITIIKTHTSFKTHISALLCCIFCCWLCAPWVYCVAKFKVKHHYCPNCNEYLGNCDV